MSRPNALNFYFRRHPNGEWEFHIGWVWIAILVGLILWAF